MNPRHRTSSRVLACLGALCWIVGAGAGCATTTIAGKPAPVPLPGDAAIAQAWHLTCRPYERVSWELRYCFQEGDPLMNYIADLEAYRDYVDSLRGNE